MANIFYQGEGRTATRMDELAQALSGDDSDDIGVQSYPTCPVTLLDLPEVNSLSAEFSYNYYVFDERTNSRGTILTFDTMNPEGQDSYNQFVRGNQLPPRSADIHIKTADWTGYFTDEAASDAQNKIDSFRRELGENIIKNNYDNIISEDTIASGYFSAAHLKDDYGDKQFYNELSSSVAFYGEDVNLVGKDTLDEMGASASTVFTADGNKVRKSLSNIQSKGVSYAPTDVRKEISVDAFTSVANIDFAMTFNNKTIGNSIDYSLGEKINIYDNELESLREDAKRIQSIAVAAENPGVIMSDEFDFGIPSVHTEVVDDSPLDGGFKVLGPTEERFDASGRGEVGDAEPEENSRPNVGEFSTPVGFIVEKFEITQLPDGNWKRTELPPIIIENFSTAVAIADPDIKYGATYIYKARLVTMTRFETLRIPAEKASDSTPDQVVMATMLLKSSGVSVKIDCTETIPPNPPQNLRFHWDYKNNELVLFWEEALNKQRDVVRYQIFKRSSVNVPFVLVKELDFDKSTSKVVPVENAPERLIQKVPGPRKSYRDKEFTKNSEKIYSVCGVDARGLTSNYSMQYKVTFDSSRNKIKVDVISRSGAPKSYPNIYLRNDLFVDTMRSSGLDRMRIFFDPESFDVIRSVYSPEAMRSNNISQKFISNNYKVQIINVDNQMSKVINIDIKDDTGEPVELTAATAESSFTRGF